MNFMTWIAWGVLAFGQPAATQGEAELKEILFPFYSREAADYEFFLDSAHARKLELQKQPVLTWTNADKYMGAVFVWTYGGRPEMIGCIGSQQVGGGTSVVFHEFHSLSQQPLAPVRFGHGQRTWRTSRPGIELFKVEGAPAPADTERARLTQMRNIAREFNGSMKDGNDITELRLLTQPLIRYKAAERGVVDGAIFALVWKGTDPEILLILEDRKDDSNDGRWDFALARFNFREMWVKRNDREVWRAEAGVKGDVYVTEVVLRTTLDEIQATAAASGKSVPSAQPK